MPEISSLKLSQKYTKIAHPSGLTLMLCPMEGFQSAYALFGARVGSIDDSFSIDGGEIEKVPAGIAHFLEHKLFESEEGDAFELYAKVGASANAYTSFDRTAYLFGCSENFTEAIEILIKQVTNPYFTDATVLKEQGIIGQEIRMYDDDPQWRVYFNLLGALYQNHPIRVDIAGTVESIAEITADTLYKCHKAFYNPSNMVLAVAGNFSIETVVTACDKLMPKSAAVELIVPEIDEPKAVTTSRVEQKLSVAAPLFQFGFKGETEGYAKNIVAQIVGEIVCDIIAGESSILYSKLYDSGLINGEFATEVMAGPSYLATIFSGESRDPDAVAKEIVKELDRLMAGGIADEDFTRAKKACFGRYVGMYNSVESMAGVMLLTEFAGMDAFDLIDAISTLTLNDAQAFLRENLDPQYSALSVVLG